MDEDLKDVYEQVVCSAFQCGIKDYHFADNRYYVERWKHPKALAAYLHSAIIELLRRNPQDADYLKCADMLNNNLSQENVKTVLRAMREKQKKEMFN